MEGPMHTRYAKTSPAPHEGKEAATASERPLGYQGEPEWRRLKKQIEWAERFWLGALFTTSPLMTTAFRRRTRELLSRLDLSFHLIRPTSPEELRVALIPLFSEDLQTTDCVWLEAPEIDLPPSAAERAGPWAAAWEDFLARLNERRDRLRRHLRGGLMLAAPSLLKPRFREVAPDLWSVRELVLEPMAVRSPSDVLEMLREAEGLLLADQPRGAVSLAWQAVEILRRADLGIARGRLLPKALATLARANGADGDIPAAIRHIREAIDLRAGKPVDRSILQWFELWLGFAGKAEDPGEVSRAVECALGYRK